MSEDNEEKNIENLLNGDTKEVVTLKRMIAICNKHKLDCQQCPFIFVYELSNLPVFSGSKHKPLAGTACTIIMEIIGKVLDDYEEESIIDGEIITNDNPSMKDILALPDGNQNENEGES